MTSLSLVGLTDTAGTDKQDAMGNNCSLACRELI